MICVNRSRNLPMMAFPRNPVPPARMSLFICNVEKGLLRFANKCYPDDNDVIKDRDQPCAEKPDNGCILYRNTKCRQDEKINSYGDPIDPDEKRTDRITVFCLRCCCD